MTNRTPRLAVVGSGYWGKNLVRNYSRLGVLKIICDKNEFVLRHLREQYPEIQTYLALDEMLSRVDIDGVAVATPAETHYKIAREILLSDKHVYVEKPLAMSESEGLELIALATKRNKIIMVGHLLQYHPAFVKLKALVSSGDLGRINYICSNRLNLGKIRREENILWSFAPHDISMILSLAGELPDSVICTGGKYLHEKIADVTTTHLAFPSGLRAHIYVSWLHPFKEQKLIVVGDRKMAVFDDIRPWPEKLLLYPHRIKWENNVPVPSKADPEPVQIDEAEPLRCECQHFLSCIVNKRAPVTDGREGLDVLQILNASQRSLDNAGRRISLADDSRPLKPRIQEKFIHQTALVDKDVSIGSGSKVWHFSHVLAGTKIGRNCNIGQNVMIGPDVVIGDNCKIQNNVSIYKGVTLEDNVFCGPSMVFTNVHTPRAELRKMDQLRRTLVKRGATIGANATIVCGVTLGAYSFIGAGAVVTKNVPDMALMIGNPSRQIGWMCKCGERLTASFECLACGKSYQKENETVAVAS